MPGGRVSKLATQDFVKLTINLSSLPFVEMQTTEISLSPPAESRGMVSEDFLMLPG